MIRRHLRSNIIGYVALFAALTTGAYAAGLKANSVKSKTIKDGAVARADIAPNAVDSSKVEDGSLNAADFGGSLPQGPAGPAGSPDTGAQILEKLASVDGSGSGLDADSLDGLQATSLVQEGDAAGGDLNGTYPDPQIADASVGPQQMSAVPTVRVGTPLEASNCVGYPAIAGDNTPEAIAFSFEELDQGLHANTPCETSTRLVAIRGGVYVVNAGVTWDQVGGPEPAGGTRFAGIRINGNDDRFVTASRIPGLAGQVPEQSLSSIVRLATGDYVELVLAQNSGSSITIDGNYQRQSFQMAWVSAG